MGINQPGSRSALGSSGLRRDSLLIMEFTIETEQAGLVFTLTRGEGNNPQLQDSLDGLCGWDYIYSIRSDLRIKYPYY
mgnify:CR=1 FL=1